MRGSIRDQLQPVADDPRQAAQRRCQGHEQAIADLTRRRDELQGRINERQRQLDKDSILASGTRPCDICQRVVKSPCHTAGGMRSEGPWDGFCAEFIENRRHAG